MHFDKFATDDFENTEAKTEHVHCIQFSFVETFFYLNVLKVVKCRYAMFKQEGHFLQILSCSSQKCDLYSVNKIVLQYNLVT